VRLHGHARAEGEPAGQEGQAAVRLLEAARHPVGAREEEEAQEEIALPRAPDAPAQMIETEQHRPRAGRDRVAHRPAVDPEEHGGRGEPGQIEEPPREIAGTAHLEHGQMQEVGAGQVHVEGVAVRHRPLLDEPGDVVHQRRVVDQGPGARGPDEVREQQGASGRNKLQ
jgi:hypothetical protein